MMMILPHSNGQEECTGRDHLVFDSELCKVLGAVDHDPYAPCSRLLR